VPAHPLGTDHLGRDLLARVAAGGWPTLEAVLAGAALAAGAGLALGLAGAAPGTPGAAARAAAQLLCAIPGLLVALAVAGVAGGGLAPAVAGLALAVPAAGQAALVVAGLAATAAAEGHVRAATALGVPLSRALRRHVWPVIRDAWVAWAASRLPRIALGYAGLAFLGLGADAGRPDWGAMVWEYRTHAFAAPWLPVAPVLGLAGLVLAARLACRPSGPRP
jgi:ABC-type dipeptide/oligopeptide/nickel transport system permease subunit